MQRLLDHLGHRAATATLPLLGFGVLIFALGAAVQVAQGMALIGPLAVPGGATVFGFAAKLGGATMLAGLLCGAVRVRSPAAANGTDPRSDPQAAPLSSRLRPGADPVRPQRVARRAGRSEGATAARPPRGRISLDKPPLGVR